MRRRKRQMTEGIELSSQEKIRTVGKRKLTNTWEYWKRTSSNKRRRKKAQGKSISRGRESYSKPNYIAEIL